jgi:hypothetical protein
MPINDQLLSGKKTSAAIVAVAKFTRKIDPSSKPPRPQDCMAWKHNGSGMPKIVFGHPSMPGVWLTSEELVKAIEGFAGKDIPFLSRKGSMPLLAPTSEGMHAWVKFARPRGRIKCVFRDGAWYPINSDEGP